MFDYYPFASGDTLRAMLLNNIIALQEANAAGIPLYTFIQSSGLEGGKEPTAEQLRLNVQLNLATGSKGIAYFTVCETYENWGYTPALDAKGNTTALYDKIKAVNEGVLAMKGVYLDYTCRGMMTAGYSGLARDFEKNGCRDYLMDSFGDLTGAKAATGGRFVIGCFENAAGVRIRESLLVGGKRIVYVRQHRADAETPEVRRCDLVVGAEHGVGCQPFAHAKILSGQGNGISSPAPPAAGTRRRRGQASGPRRRKPRPYRQVRTRPRACSRCRCRRTARCSGSWGQC